MNFRKAVKVSILCFIAYGWATTTAAQPYSFVDTIPYIESSLDEITVEGVGSKRMIEHLKNGDISLNATLIDDVPTILGGGDMLSVIRSLGDVTTASDMNASFSVRGLSTGSNLYTANDVRIGNPIHLLGLYSAFPPRHYDRYSLSTFPDVTLPYNTSSAVMSAETDTLIRSECSGSACIGLIESHGNIAVPLAKSRPAVIRLAFRQSYLDKVFPGILKAGTSSLGYAFTDGGVTIQSKLSSRDFLSISFAGARDGLYMHNDVVGEKEATAGWSNIVAGLNWKHARFNFGLGYTRFHNKFETTESFQVISLPSSLNEITLYGDYKAATCWRMHFDAHLRKMSGQINTAAINNSGDYNVPGHSIGWELNPSASWRKRLGSVLAIDAGLRLSLFTSRSYGDNYYCIVPQPRLSIDFNLPASMTLSARYSRLARFDRLVEESATGMPVNFFINCTRDIKYEDNHSLELLLNGIIPAVWVDFQLSAYYIDMHNVGEYGGGLLNFSSAGYNPLEDMHFGNGYSVGMSLSIMRQFGALRGHLNYRFGCANLKIPFFSDHYFPSSQDRRHDLTANLTWQFLRHFTLSGNFTYASGTPYTKAKYGYIIGENLICEYYPHNSSRLPDYKRLDISLTYRLRRKRLTHEFNLSVYNALAFRNTLFIFNAYSMENGVTVKESVMKSVIPSFAYTINF